MACSLISADITNNVKKIQKHKITLRVEIKKITNLHLINVGRGPYLLKADSIFFINLNFRVKLNMNMDTDVNINMNNSCIKN
jgi:hypothetical protein